MNEQKLAYIIKHEPQRYVLKRVWGIFWRVDDLKGNPASAPTIFKIVAETTSSLYNSIYSCGYALGCNAVLREWVECEKQKEK